MRVQFSLRLLGFAGKGESTCCNHLANQQNLLTKFVLYVLWLYATIEGNSTFIWHLQI